MILMRLEPLGGKYCDLTGGQDKYKYSEKDQGWMPIESMDFGITESSKSKAGGRSGISGNRSAGNRGGGGANRTDAPAAASSDNDDSARISVSRFVDLATPQLMGFAMEDRTKTKSEMQANNQKMRKADFHFLHSVAGDDGRYIYPYMLITLEDVLIKNWKISAGGDDRPREDLELWYDKAALRYYRTVDGKTWIGGDIKAWNQHENKPWQIVEGSEPPFFRSPKS